MDDSIARIVASATSNASDLPGFPPTAVQERFVGQSGEAALLEVVPFFELIDSNSRIGRQSVVLDFGVGWGRIARFYQDVVLATNMYLADVDPEALEWCRTCRVQGIPILVDPMGALSLETASIDVAYSYSVFSHLSADAALHWFNELHRVLKPRSYLVFTAQSLRFLDLVNACALKSDANAIERSIGRYMGPNPARAVDRYKRGEHAYSDVNGGGGGGILSGEFYGWAAIPPEWFENNLRSKFAIEDYIDDASRFEQAVYVARRL